MNRLRIVMRGGGISHTSPAPAAFRNYDHAARCMASKERSFMVSGGTISYGTILSSYSYQYDECNNLTKLTCSVAGSTWSTVYTYDSDNRPSTTTLANNTVIIIVVDIYLFTVDFMLLKNNIFLKLNYLIGL